MINSLTFPGSQLLRLADFDTEFLTKRLPAFKLVMDLLEVIALMNVVKKHLAILFAAAAHSQSCSAINIPIGPVSLAQIPYGNLHASLAGKPRLQCIAAMRCYCFS